MKFKAICVEFNERFQKNNVSGFFFINLHKQNNIIPKNIMVYIKFPNNCLCFSPDCKRPKTNIQYHVMSQAITVS